MTIKMASSVGVLVGALSFVGAASGAMAAATPVERSPTKVADTSQARIAAADEDDSATCIKSRKRLWVEGEGWVVRRVATCR